MLNIDSNDKSVSRGNGRRPFRITKTIVAAGVCAVAAGLALINHQDTPPAAAAAEVKPVLAAAGVKSGPVADDAVGRLGNETVNRQEVRQWLGGLPSDWQTALKDKPDVREQWLREHLAEKALVAEALSKKWDQRPEVVSAVRAAEQQILLRSYLDSVSQVPQSYPSAEELSAAYEQAKVKLQVPARYHLSQIYLAAPAADTAAVASVRKQAETLSTRAQAKGADFAALARQYSQDAQSVAQGGDIGPQPLQQLTPEVRTVVAALGKGNVSEPVQSASGFHIIKLEDIQPARTATLEEVTPQLRAALRQQRQRQMEQDYLAHMTTAAPLTINDAALTAAITQP